MVWLALSLYLALSLFLLLSVSVVARSTVSLYPLEIARLFALPPALETVPETAPVSAAVLA